MTLEEWDMQVQGLTREEWLRLKRRARLREWLQTAGAVSGGTVAVALGALLSWLFLAAT